MSSHGLWEADAFCWSADFNGPCHIIMVQNQCSRESKRRGDGNNFFLDVCANEAKNLLKMQLDHLESCALSAYHPVFWSSIATTKSPPIRWSGEKSVKILLIASTVQLLRIQMDVSRQKTISCKHTTRIRKCTLLACTSPTYLLTYLLYLHLCRWTCLDGSRNPGRKSRS